MHAGEEVGIDDVGRLGLHDHRLVGILRARLDGRDERRADIGHVGPHRLRGEDGAAIGDGPGEQQRPVEPAPDLLHQREGRQRAGVAARPGRDRDQPVRALLDRLARMPVVNDVVQHDPAIGMHRLVDLLDGAERGDHDGHLVLHAHFEVVLQAGVGLVHDLVDRIGRGRPLGVCRVMGGEALGDLGQPFVELRLGAGVQRRKRSDDAGLALREHQGRVRNDEERRSDDRNAQVPLQNVRYGHGVVHSPRAF